MREHFSATIEPWGNPLSERDLGLANLLRLRLADEIPKKYDTDFNLYRWILHAQRYHKTEEGILNSAEDSLTHHLKLRKALKLDHRVIPTWDENPIHKERYLPKGPLQGIDKHNRVLWCSEYKSINIEALMQKLKSSDMLIFHFLMYERLLEAAMKREAATGRLSGIHLIADLNEYHMSPLSMLFVRFKSSWFGKLTIHKTLNRRLKAFRTNNGSMGYYTHLFHYEHYPELLHPIDLVNTARWITIPYRLVKSIMPHGFSDRFRIHGSHYKDTLLKSVDESELPSSLGGTNTSMKFVSARKIGAEEYWKPSDSDPKPQDLQHIVVRPRSRKLIPIDVEKTPAKLSWYYTTDAELHFGIYYLPNVTSDSNESQPSSSEEDIHNMTNDQIVGRYKDKKIDIEEMEMVEPYFRLGARMVPENSGMICEKPGRYFMVFCNRNAWLTRRNIRLQIELEATPKFIIQRTLSM